jgi:hypothetical protein
VIDAVFGVPSPAGHDTLIVGAALKSESSVAVSSAGEKLAVGAVRARAGQRHDDGAAVFTHARRIDSELHVPLFSSTAPMSMRPPLTRGRPR